MSWREPVAEPLTYTLDQLAARLQTSIRTVQAERRAGRFPWRALPGMGRRVLFSREQVERDLAHPERLRARRG